MAASSFFLVLMLLLTCTLHADGCYTSIISFGDSLADTGNAKELVRHYNQNPPHFLFPPYGETYFHKPTGRCSNGRLIIDFIAESLGLALLPPYVGGEMVDWGGGVNYAVASATALDSSFHEARGYTVPTNASLRIQVGWFKQSLQFLCGETSDCRYLIQESLILMGEIGGNDYNHALDAGKSLEDIKSYVPLVVDAIILVVNELIELGARTLVIPGNLPIGCSADFLTIYYGSNGEEYDNTTGCHIRLNKLAEYHNQLLQKELSKIRELHPNINIIYGDYYNAAMQFYRSPDKFGFTNGALMACCGGGGPFNFNSKVKCGNPSSSKCGDPNTYANWDGLHLTEAAYGLIYKGLFEGSYTTPQCNSLCPIRLQAIGGLSEFA